ncbi:shikimate dehydrogenase family protein [Rhodovibrio salinarum]|uniref:Shikimate dehydrogenase substrate binding N-terminal domain-containing protein n=1 Tax=Rhodovibrio salinarum TaxID=1087 RepID=A0A934QHN7_9PROT|nr:hypothetical protein [Rhodovibrio salinarum]MBK1697216.1 hypothetical protein [Rhodovibrio salinarum]
MQRLFAIIGDPVKQARSPDVFNALAAERGVDAIMLSLHVGAEDFAGVLDGLSGVRNFEGAVVTIPHKRAAFLQCGSHGRAAEAAGVANVVRKTGDGLHGDLFDGFGMVNALRRAGVEPDGRSTLVVGAGGAGVAVAFALAEAGAAPIQVRDRDTDRCRQLVHQLTQSGYPACEFADDFQGLRLVVNCTPLGLDPADPLPVAPERLDPDCVVADAVMAGRATRLTAAASARGHAVVPGEEMLAGQMPAIWSFFGLPGETDISAAKR